MLNYTHSELSKNRIRINESNHPKRPDGSWKKHCRQIHCRTDEWLKVSTKSLEYFSSLDNTLDTTNLSIKDVAEKIING